MTKSNIIETGYKPRPFQALLHSRLQRGNVLVCHRGFGKTIFTINHLIDDALRCEHEYPLYAYIAPNYSQAKRIAWEELKKYTKNIPGVESNEADLRLDIRRPHKGDFARIMLLGAEKPGSIRGIHLNGAAIDEFAECDPTIWTEVVNPALRQKKGWVIFIGTPKGMNHFYDIYQIAKANPDHWFTVTYKVSETGLVDQLELDAARSVMSEEQYQQEFECSFTAAVVGAYYSKEIKWLESYQSKNKTHANIYILDKHCSASCGQKKIADSRRTFKFGMLELIYQNWQCYEELNIIDNTDSITYYGYPEYKWRRKIRESFMIRVREPAMNRDCGYELPAIYDELLLHDRASDYVTRELITTLNEGAVMAPQATST